MEVEQILDEAARAQTLWAGKELRRRLKLIGEVARQIAESGEDVHRIGPLKRLTMWALNVRRDTNGEVSFLVLSERNAAGETKGRFGDHKADLVVSIKSEDDSHLGKRIAVTKAWESECGDLGLFALDPRRARLTKVGD